jgi:hypothetical protein
VNGYPQVARIAVDSDERLPGGRQSQQIPADPGAEVGDPADAREPRGAMASERFGGRLFQSGTGEQHLRRVGESPGRAAAQLRLAERGGDQIGRVPGRAQPASGAELVARRERRGRGGEKPQTLWGTQRVELPGQLRQATATRPRVTAVRVPCRAVAASRVTVRPSTAGRPGTG